MLKIIEHLSEQWSVFLSHMVGVSTNTGPISLEIKKIDSGKILMTETSNAIEIVRATLWEQYLMV